MIKADTVVDNRGSNTSILPKIFGLAAPALFPPLHIAVLYYFWNEYSRHVDKRYCTCSCWDTVFKGTYETGIASYKHMYFNATSSVFKIWLITVVCIISLYECVQYLMRLAVGRTLRLTMLVLFSSTIFSHYYSWWAYVNYWNDDFYSQWYHQLFFTITELISTVLVLHLANSQNSVTIRKTFGIISVAVLHVLLASRDQFVTNVLKGEGNPHQIIRDLGFMIPDILHIILPVCLLRCTKRATGLRHCFTSEIKREFFFSCLFISRCSDRGASGVFAPGWRDSKG